MKKLRNNILLRYKRTLILLGSLIVVASGCSLYNLNISTPLITDGTSFEEGIHYGEVLDRLGAPGKVSALSNGFVFLYEFYSTAEAQVNPKFQKEELKYWKVDAATGSAERQTILLVFDGQGILRNQQVHQGEEDIGMGAGVNFLVSNTNLLDTGYLENPAAVDDWGILLLKPIDELLNLPYSLETGTHGLEQIGTPRSVGQHSLEFE